MATRKSDDPEGGDGVSGAGAGAPDPLRPEAVADLPPADPDAALAPSSGAPGVSAADRTGAAAAPPAPAHDAVEEEAHEEERGWSFAARALAVVALIVAGAALGIWAAPRLAPMLPAGMAPVAAWLTPGRTAAEAEAEARVAALRGELSGALAALEARIAALPDDAALASRAEALTADAEGRLGARIDAMSAALEEADSQASSERIGRLEAGLDGAAAELASLKEQIDAGAAGAGGDAAASIDLYRAELDGVKAEVGRLAGAVSGLDSRLDAAESRAASRIEEVEARAAEAQQAAVAERDVSAARAQVERIRAALASGEPFAEPLDALAAEAAAPPPPGLEAAAATGVATPAALRASFADRAHQALRASISASAGEGMMARSRAFFEAQVASRSLAPRAGLDPDAVLSRMEDALRRDDLAAALAEAESLPSEARAAMDAWIVEARRRADAEAGLAQLDASVAALN